MKRTLKQTVLQSALLSALALGAASVSFTSHAASATSNMTVTASVAANCTISASATAFGAYDPVQANASTALDGTGMVTVTCTSGAATTVTLGQGANAASGSSDAAPQRRMVSGSNHLTYSLYSESTRATAWGNTAASGLSHTGTGTATNLTVYGRIPAGQNVPAGSYADTVVATVTF